MAVGVPENDVFAAADAVLARGERPTVERVRLELGRGSPARVGALLDQWWEQLAGRLRGETRLPGLPAEVAQAFVAVWQKATTLAEGVVEQSLESQRQVLAGEREQLTIVEDQVRQDASRARKQTAEALVARQVVETRLADLEQLLAQRQWQIDDLREQREELLGQRDEARQQLVEARQQLQDSRQLAEQTREAQQRYTRDVEDRAYREIDRAREEGKALSAQLKEANGQSHAAQCALQTAQAALAETREQRATAQTQTEALLSQLQQAREAGVASHEHAHSLQLQLQVVQEALANAREQAAAAQARAETLSQQMSAAGNPAPTERVRRQRKSAPI
ncbi:DNA-binding protein [Pseudomonas sp. 22526]|uniref:DNA-binding protein n=1 Tax=Pseudomonas sp. 22526 TaxID=3453937 RepID=UPI003F85FB39